MQVMIDLETMGLSPDAATISLGAVAFDLDGIKSEFYRNIDLASVMDSGGILDAGTIMWWIGQETSAKKVLTEDRLPLAVVLLQFTAWLKTDATAGQGDEVYVWGNGATADNIWLARAYARTQLNRPWSYKNDRCYRTLRALFPHIEADIERGAVQHNALHDARYQALHAIKIFNQVPSVGAAFRGPKHRITSP